MKKRNLIKLTSSCGGVLVFLDGMRSVFPNSSFVRSGRKRMMVQALYRGIQYGGFPVQ